MIYLFAIERRTIAAPVFPWLIRLVQFIHFRKYWHVTHVGLVNNHEVIEAVAGGVIRHDLAVALDHYKKQKNIIVWRIPIKGEFHFKGVHAWIRAEELVGKRYDWRGALNAGLDLLEMIIGQQCIRRDNNWFCSEIVAHAFHCDDPSEQTPADVCDWPFWNWHDGAKLVDTCPKNKA